MRFFLMLPVILPLLAGAAVGGLLFAKAVHHFIVCNRKSTYFAIIGLTAGSVFTVAVQAAMRVDDGGLAVQCVAASAAGVVLGWCMRRLNRRYVLPSGPDHAARASVQLLLDYQVADAVERRRVYQDDRNGRQVHRVA